jgi:hypothetical protein
MLSPPRIGWPSAKVRKIWLGRPDVTWIEVFGDCVVVAKLPGSR